MSYGIAVKVWGDYACFTRPEMKVERVSYDVITPSACRGILEAIYWKPEIKWVIDKIHVLKPVIYQNIRRNELSKIISSRNVSTVMKGGDADLELVIEGEGNRQQRASLVLKDVEYIIEAHFELKDKEDGNTAKHKEIFERRAKKGQCFMQPYLGTREFSAFFEYINPSESIPESPIKGEKDLGWMLYDIDFKNNMQAIFFRARMRDGIIDLTELSNDEVKR
ncbi:MAG: type I-C CRISPR-associated protein Cas5 [Spirochaetales bacterium]|nr:type I-C CRISPR-associated protein Cas5 [Spirochaetales bacterium]